jgi:hypothetical protein
MGALALDLEQGLLHLAEHDPPRADRIDGGERWVDDGRLQIDESTAACGASTTTSGRSTRRRRSLFHPSLERPLGRGGVGTDGVLPVVAPRVEDGRSSSDGQSNGSGSNCRDEAPSTMPAEQERPRRVSAATLSLWEPTIAWDAGGDGCDCCEHCPCGM